MSTRWIVTGRSGQLGRCLCARLEAERDASLRALGRDDLDLGDPSAIDRYFDELARDPSPPESTVVINAAAYTAVDRCEEEEALALRINGEAPAQIAARCAERGMRFVHVSTDYVFDGRGQEPYAVDAATAPRTAYGRTKLAGEVGVLAAHPEALVVRTSWVFGPGKNFVGAILRQARLRRSGDAKGPLRVVADQRGCPTYADDLAQGILELVRSGASGLFHLSNAGAISWWDFARAILDATGHADLEIDRVETSELALPAERPAFSVLDTSLAAERGVRLRPWRQALAAYLETLGPADGLAA